MKNNLAKDVTKQRTRRVPGATDARRIRTRAALVQAGHTLFAQRSIDAVSIDDIVLAAAVAKGSFYNHFADKNALAHEVLSLVREDLEAQVEAANADVADPAGRSARAMCVYVRMALQDPQRGRLIAKLLTENVSVEAPINRGLVKDTAAGLAEGRYVISTVEVGVVFTLGVAQALISRVIVEESRLSVVSITQQLVTLKLRGLGVAALDAEMIAARAADDIIRFEA